MDAMWVPFLRGFDWAISWWCCSFGCYKLQWLWLTSLTSLQVDPQLPASSIVPPIGSFTLRVCLSGGVRQWIGSVGFPDALCVMLDWVWQFLCNILVAYCVLCTGDQVC